MSRWVLSYNTNGFAHHRLEDAVDILAELGYGGIALTPDVHHLDPFAPDLAERAERLRRLTDRKCLALTIETGARFNLEARRKHYPSLLCADGRERRIDFLVRCVDLASRLGAPSVSLWSGHNFESLDDRRAEDLLVEGLARVLEVADRQGVDIGFEPEPGMFTETVAGYARLRDRLRHRRFRLALDTGHLMVTQDSTPAAAIGAFAADLSSVTVEDMRLGVHEHLPFGEGDMDFDALFAALRATSYAGPIIVELSRSSPNAVKAAADSIAFLRPFIA